MEFLQWLNPKYEYFPSEAFWASDYDQAGTLYERLKQEFGPTVKWEHHFEDASCHAWIFLSDKVYISLSNFACLATVNDEDFVAQQTLSRTITILEELGYTYIPYRFFRKVGDASDQRRGVLFQQLFDFI